MPPLLPRAIARSRRSGCRRNPGPARIHGLRAAGRPRPESRQISSISAASSRPAGEDLPGRRTLDAKPERTGASRTVTTSLESQHASTRLGERQQLHPVRRRPNSLQRTLGDPLMHQAHNLRRLVRCLEQRTPGQAHDSCTPARLCREPHLVEEVGHRLTRRPGLRSRGNPPRTPCELSSPLAARLPGCLHRSAGLVRATTEASAMARPAYSGRGSSLSSGCLPYSQPGRPRPDAGAADRQTRPAPRSASRCSRTVLACVPVIDTSAARLVGSAWA